MEFWCLIFLRIWINSGYKAAYYLNDILKAALFSDDKTKKGDFGVAT